MTTQAHDACESNMFSSLVKDALQNSFQPNTNFALVTNSWPPRKLPIFPPLNVPPFLNLKKHVCSLDAIKKNATQVLPVLLDRFGCVDTWQHSRSEKFVTEEHTNKHIQPRSSRQREKKDGTSSESHTPGCPPHLAPGQEK